MRYFTLLNIQHFIAYIFPGVVLILLVGTALAYSHFQRKDSEAQMSKIIHRYPLDIEERNAPFPLVLILIIIGTVLWGFGYIIGNGVLGVKI